VKPNVCYGSKPDMAIMRRDVRFAPNSGHQNWPALTAWRSSSGSLAMFAAILRASLLFVVSLLEFGRTLPHTLRVKPVKLDSALHYKARL
jgi:hypothetical protein